MAEEQGPRCLACNGTGRTPKIDEAYSRIMAANNARSDADTEPVVYAEDGVLWSDVMALARFWREKA